MDLNPLIRLNLQTTRTWNDRAGLGINNDFVPQCNLLNPAANGECGPMDNQNFGKEFFTRTFDPNFINGFGKRPYNWELGVSVQQEVASRVGVTVGYYRRWFGNFYTLDNTLTAASDYTQFSVPVPLDPRLPGGGGGLVPGVYNLNPNKVGQVQDLALLDSDLGAEPTENWQGVDFGVNARLRNGFTVQGGTSTGRTLQDNCAVRSKLPETYPWSTIVVTQSLRGDSTAGLTAPYCRIVEPWLTSFRGLATYVVPKVDVQVSGTWRSDPGVEEMANYTVTNAIANSGPQPLGRPLSSGNITVNLIPRYTLVFGAPQQHRFPCGEDPPLRQNAHASGARRLQSPEQRRRHDREQHVRAEHPGLADAADRRHRAVREGQRAVRFLEREMATTKARRHEENQSISSSCFRVFVA